MEYRLAVPLTAAAEMKECAAGKKSQLETCLLLPSALNYVCCSDNPHVYRTCFGKTKGSVFLFLKETQQFHLDEGMEAGDLIQKQGAAPSSDARVRPGCSRESTWFMTEQLILRQVDRDRATVNGNKRFVGAGTKLMDSTRE